MSRRGIVALLASLLATVVFLTTLSPAGATGGSWCSALAAGNPIVDVVGDSIGAGVGAPDDVRWHVKLRDSLLSGGAPGTQVWTGGAIPGSATADYVAGAKYSNHIEFVAHQPNLIIIILGTNDWSAGIPVDDFRAQYQQILDRIHVLDPDATLFLAHAPWVYNPELLATRGSQVPYKNVIEELAAANNAHYLAYEWGNPGGNPYGFSTTDLVHLTDIGQNQQFAITHAAVTTICQGRV